MRNRIIAATILRTLIVFLTVQTCAGEIQKNAEHPQPPRHQLAIAYAADLGHKYIATPQRAWILGQGCFDPALKILEQEGYKVINIFDPLNGGKFIEFKQAWDKEENQGGIVFFLNHGAKPNQPKGVQIGMFDNQSALREFLQKLHQLGYNRKDYYVDNMDYTEHYYLNKKEKRFKVYAVFLRREALEKFSDKKDLAIWAPCSGEETVEAVPANIKLYRQGPNYASATQKATKQLFARMSKETSPNKLSFTQAFQRVDWCKRYNYLGPDNGADLLLTY